MSVVFYSDYMKSKGRALFWYWPAIMAALTAGSVFAADDSATPLSGQPHEASPSWQAGLLAGTSIIASGPGTKFSYGAEAAFRFADRMEAGLYLHRSQTDYTTFPSGGTRTVHLSIVTGQWNYLFEQDNGLGFHLGAKAGLAFLSYKEISHTAAYLTGGPGAGIDYRLTRCLSIGVESSVLWIGGAEYAGLADLLGSIKVRW